MKICCLNNYPLAKMSALADAGRIPRQHTWGIEALAERGHRVVLAPFHEPFEDHPLDLASRALRPLARPARPGAPRADPPRGRRRLLRRPAEPARPRPRPAPPARGAALISVVHHPLSPGARNRRVLHGHDLLVALSERLRDDLVRDHGLPPERVTVGAWGPDLSSPLYRATGAGPVVSAGKSNRDLPTLMAALAESRVPAIVYDLAAQVADAPDGVRLVQPGGRGVDPASSGGGYLMEAVMDDLRAAKAVAFRSTIPGA